MSRANNRNTRFLPASVTLNFKGTPKRTNGCLDKIEAKTASPTFLSATVHHITLKFLALLACRLNKASTIARNFHFVSAMKTDPNPPTRP